MTEFESIVAAVAVERVRQAKARSGQGWVYAIAAEEVRRVKFGFSASPERRLADMATSSPVPLKIIARRRGTFQDEGEVHRRLAGSRAHGEWFNLDADVERLLNEWVAGSIPAAPTINRR